MFSIGQVTRMAISKQLELPATTAWVSVGDKVTIVGEWKDNEEFEFPENKIYMVEWGSDSFTCGYRFPVRAKDLESI
jgi:hypothetical protein